jgi:aspartyl-tRNA(Asn)/glutamyl-tRNA(Gln) amidotransferase subunit A
LTQQPAASVPCGFTGAGLPVAMQLVAAKWAERTVLRAARAYETAHPFRMPPAPAGIAGPHPVSGRPR